VAVDRRSKKDPGIISALQAVVEPETAGDPMRDQKWVRSSLRHLSTRLGDSGHPASPPTVARLLDKLGYALHVNAKKIEASAEQPDRQAQFDHIVEQKAAFAAAGQPIISVDTKKKELIGNFKNGGATWHREAAAVNVHDFRQDTLGRAVPYGIYEPLRNQGTVYVGQSADTPHIAVDVIAHWWQSIGYPSYVAVDRLLILADGGGSSAYRSRLWKQRIQEQLCDRHGLTVTVCHYPTGCSEWNPVEHRLFGPISLNWAGQSLLDWETLLAFIRGTKTTTGLTVQAFLHEGVYKAGSTASDAEMEMLSIEHYAVCAKWSYTIRPHSGGQAQIQADPAKRELISRLWH
jgi:hypothetical protein